MTMKNRCQQAYSALSIALLQVTTDSCCDSVDDLDDGSLPVKTMSFNLFQPKLLYKQAVKIKKPPTNVSVPNCSPTKMAAQSAPHKGSVDKRSVVSAAVRVMRATDSMYTDKAVEMTPVQKKRAMVAGSVK